MPVFPTVDPLSIAVYAALAGVVFVATLRRASDAIVALVATAPFDFSHALGPTTITFDKVALIAAALALALRRAPPTPLFRGAPRALAFAMLAVIAATVLSIAVAQYREPAIRETFKGIQYLIVFVVAAIAWSLDPDRRRLQLVLTLTASAVAILAAAQEFTGGPSVFLFEGATYVRSSGPLEGPNQLAGYLGIALPFFVVWAVERASWTTLAATAITSGALILTLSRAGVACGIVGAAIVLVIQQRGSRTAATGAFAAGVAAAIALLVSRNADILSHFFTFDEVTQAGGVGYRSMLWRAAIALWQRHPVLGVGAGNFELLLPSVGDVGIRTHANSWYLQSLVEGGIPLLAATCALVWESIAPFRRALSNPLCLAMFAASIAFALHGFVDYLVFYPKVAITWFTLLGIAAIETCGPSRS